MVINAVLRGFELEVPAKTDVRFVDPYEPAAYAFNGYRRGLTPDELRLRLRDLIQQRRGTRSEFQA